MIKAADLRIGDLVIVNENCSLEQGTIGKVSEVRSTPLYKENEGSIGLKPISNDRWPCGVLCRNIDPIPLTPEILEKNGWKKKIFYVQLHKSVRKWHEYTLPGTDLNIDYRPYIALDTQKFSINYEYLMLKYIKYVHELQHILWALGLDAEIKL